jgi:hypothetical protein
MSSSSPVRGKGTKLMSNRQNTRRNSKMLIESRWTFGDKLLHQIDLGTREDSPTHLLHPERHETAHISTASASTSMSRTDFFQTPW